MEAVLGLPFSPFDSLSAVGRKVGTLEKAFYLWAIFFFFTF
jgi:hypothetical protein